MELTVEVRDAKKSSKTLRNEGSLPAVVYGRSEEAAPITINRKEFEKVFKAAGESQVISLKGLGVSKDVLIKAVETDAVSGFPIHADFYAIQKGQTVTVSVPLEFEGTSEAVKSLGGILTKVMHELELECEPKDLPPSIKVDISALVDLDSQILIKDLKLPASIKISAEPDDVVALISVAEEEPVEVAAPVDISAIGISEERGKKEEAEGESAPATEAESKE
jgi:large subunit ribosomal protein L25